MARYDGLIFAGARASIISGKRRPRQVSILRVSRRFRAPSRWPAPSLSPRHGHHRRACRRRAPRRFRDIFYYYRHRYSAGKDRLPRARRLLVGRRRTLIMHFAAALHFLAIRARARCAGHDAGRSERHDGRFRHTRKSRHYRLITAITLSAYVDAFISGAPRLISRASGLSRMIARRWSGAKPASHFLIYQQRTPIQLIGHMAGAPPPLAAGDGRGFITTSLPHDAHSRRQRRFRPPARHAEVPPLAVSHRLRGWADYCAIIVQQRSKAAPSRHAASLRIAGERAYIYALDAMPMRLISA